MTPPKHPSRYPLSRWEFFLPTKTELENLATSKMGYPKQRWIPIKNAHFKLAWNPNDALFARQCHCFWIWWTLPSCGQLYYNWQSVYMRYWSRMSVASGLRYNPCSTVNMSKIQNMHIYNIQMHPSIIWFHQAVFNSSPYTSDPQCSDQGAAHPSVIGGLLCGCWWPWGNIWWSKSNKFCELTIMQTNAPSHKQIGNKSCPASTCVAGIGSDFTFGISKTPTAGTKPCFSVFITFATQRAQDSCYNIFWLVPGAHLKNKTRLHRFFDMFWTNRALMWWKFWYVCTALWPIMCAPNMILCDINCILARWKNDKSTPIVEFWPCRCWQSQRKIWKTIVFKFSHGYFS